MKRLLFVAPGVQAPWTEGRKAFVRDLADGVRLRGEHVEILSGTSGRVGRLRSVLAPFMSYRELKARLRDGDEIDAVVIFPHGRFNGLQGAINRWFLRLAQMACAKKNVTAAPLFYSCAGIDFNKLSILYAPALTVGRGGDKLTEIILSIHHGNELWKSDRQLPARFLFLCGYQKALHSELNSVLKERGLQDLLDVGNVVAELGGALTIAIPFLRNKKLRHRLAEIVERSCPQLSVQMLDEVSAKEIFLKHDVFVFPYRDEHAVFTPTSLLEAMSSGIPTVAADHAMYRSLTYDNGEAICALFKPADSTSLSAVIRSLSSKYGHAIDQAKAARERIRRNWTIDRSAQQLLDFIDVINSARFDERRQ